MQLRKLASVIEFFTLKRAKVYALLSLTLGVLIVLSAFVESPDRLTGATDFPAFYNAGRILKESSGTNLYDRDLQRKLYLEIAPTAANRQNLFFVYTPFLHYCLRRSLFFLIWARSSAGS